MTTITTTTKPDLSGVLAQIRRQVGKGKADPRIRNYALRITGRVTPDETGHPNRRDYHALAVAIYGWMRRNIAYVRDPHHIERISDAATVIREGSGDCDDMVVLGASLLSSLGVPVRFVTIATNPAAPDEYTHIYFEYQAGTFWLPFDATLENGRAGFLPSATMRMQRKIWTMRGNTQVLPSGTPITLAGNSSTTGLSGCNTCGLNDGNLGIFGTIASAVTSGIDIVSGGPKQRARAAARDLEASENYLEAQRLAAQQQAVAVQQYAKIAGIIAASTVGGFVIYKLL